MAPAPSTTRAGWGAGALPWLLAAQLQFTAAQVLLHRLPLALGVVATIALSAMTVIGCHYLLGARDVPPAWFAWLSRVSPVVVGGFLLAALACLLVVHPVFRFGWQQTIGTGTDVDDAALLVLDGLQRGVENPFAVNTYLGFPVTTGPGALLWFWPFGLRLYPLGIFVALAGLFVLVRRVSGSWLESAIAGALLAGSVAFWQALAHGTDRVVFACGLAAVGVYFDRRPAKVAPGAVLVAVLGVGALATFRFAYLHVPLLVGAALWQQGRRRLGLGVGLGGTAVAVMLHGAFIARSSWEGYSPIHHIVTKSQDDLSDVGEWILMAALVATAVALLVALQRPGGPRVSTMLLIGVGGPMMGTAVASLTMADAPIGWGNAAYFVESLVLASVTAAALAARRHSRSAPTEPRAVDDEPTVPVPSGQAIRA